jgi:predicted nucleic acid-binding protein
MVLVDTTIWSLALRRRRRNLSAPERRIVEEWVSLVREGSAALVGPVRQEILSGVRDAVVFSRLQGQLSAFAHLPILPRDYDQAAAFYNTCRAAGITGAPVDMLLCAVAARSRCPLFTTDRDFTRYSQHVPITLFRVRP